MIKKTKKNKVKVSILCITYNQEKFIKQALNSFIMQKTNFDYEIIIGDDHSTDKTTSIIKEFEKKFPNIIKPIYRKKNIGISNNLFDILQKAKGQYISLCAGDDYFTNENKLQIQSDFLDKNPKYSMCFHLTKVFFENGEQKDSIFPDIKKTNIFTTTELLKDNFMQASSVMYRSLTYKNLPTDIIPEDWYLHLYHAKNGKIGFINKIMSAYRIHKSGVWWNRFENPDKLIKQYGISRVKMYLGLLKLFNKNKEYKKIINQHIYETLDYFIKVTKDITSIKMIKILLIKNTKLCINYILEKQTTIEQLQKSNLEKENNKLKDSIIIEKFKLEQKIETTKIEIDNYTKLIDQIINSKFYKIWQFFCNFKKVLNI